MASGPTPRNGIWFPDCGGDPEPGVADFSNLDYRDSVELRGRTTIQDFIQKVWNGQDQAAVERAIDALVDPNYKRHYEGKVLQGRANLKKCVGNMHSAVSEFHITVSGMTSSYNLVGTSIQIRWVVGKPHEMKGVEMYRLHNDLIAESWHATERAGQS